MSLRVDGPDERRPPPRLAPGTGGHTLPPAILRADHPSGKRGEPATERPGHARPYAPTSVHGRGSASACRGLLRAQWCTDEAITSPGSRTGRVGAKGSAMLV